MQQPLRKEQQQTPPTPNQAFDLRSTLGMAARRRRTDRDRQGGRSRPAGHRPAEAHGRRLSDPVQQRQGQAEPSRHHQSVRRHFDHQPHVRLEGRRRARAEARVRAVASAQAGGDRAERSAVPGIRRREAGRRQQMDGADPPYHLRARADRRLRHPLRHRRAIRWRLRPRLQPHEFPLGQCRHVPDLARLAHVAGGQQILQGRPAGADHHVLRRAAGLHA